MSTKKTVRFEIKEEIDVSTEENFFLDSNNAAIIIKCPDYQNKIEQYKYIAIIFDNWGTETDVFIFSLAKYPTISLDEYSSLASDPTFFIPYHDFNGDNFRLHAKYNSGNNDFINIPMYLAEIPEDVSTVGVTFALPIIYYDTLESLISNNELMTFLRNKIRFCFCNKIKD